MISLFGVKKPEHLRALIEVCFNPTPDSRHFQLLCEAIEFDELSAEQYRVLPLLYCRSDLARFSQRVQTAISSAYKHTLYRNHMLLHRAKLFERSVVALGFEPAIFIKGIAYALRTRDGLGARPMVDIDLLIPNLFERAEDFCRALYDLSFKKIGSLSRSVSAISPEKFEFDIHWYLSDWAMSQHLVDNLVSNSEFISFRDTSYQVPCKEHHLIHVLGHGVLNPLLTYDARWSIDVLSMLTEYRGLDCDRMVEFANMFDARSQLKKGFEVVYKQTPKAIEIDRELLSKVASKIKPDGRVVQWLFNKEPFCNAHGINGKPVRSIWFNYIVMFYVYAPFYLWLHNNISLSKSIRISQHFPPETTIYRSIQRNLTRICRRLPFVLFNVWIPKKQVDSQ